MMINQKIYIIVACLFLLVAVQHAVPEDEVQNKYLPTSLQKPDTIKVEKTAEFTKTTIQVINPLVNNSLKFEILVDGKAGIAPLEVDFKVGKKINIKINNADYIPAEYNYTLQSTDADSTINVFCYPKLVVVKGDVLNPDGSAPAGVEVKLSESLPKKYFPAYHKLRNYVDAEGKYFLLLPENAIKDKINLHFSTFKNSYDAELSLMKSQAIKAANFEIPTYEIEIAMPDESLVATPVEEVLSTLKFKDNGELSFEQAFKIEKVATLLDYSLLISTYISSFKLAEDDVTRDFIKSRLLPIILDVIKHAEISNDNNKGLALAKQAKEIFTDNSDIDQFIEIFEYNNIPAVLKSALNDAFTAFNEKDFRKSFYLLKDLAEEKLLTEKLRAKVVKAFKESRDSLIRVHLKNATDFYTNKEYLKSLWEIDRACEFSKDLPFLQELAERNLALLKSRNQDSKQAMPLRAEWFKSTGDIEFNKLLAFEKPENQQWFLLDLKNYAQVSVELPLKHITEISYKLMIYTVNEETLAPDTELFSFDSINIRLPENKKEGIGLSGKIENGGNGPGIGIGGGPGGAVVEEKVPDDQPKEKSETPTYGIEFFKQKFEDFLFSEGKYFICVQADQIEGFEFKDAYCGLILNATQIKDHEDVAISSVAAGTDKESAAEITRGFYTPLKIKSKSSHWFQIDIDGDRHLELSLAGSDDFENLNVKTLNANDEEMNADKKDAKAGSYLFKLTKDSYFIEITNNSDRDFDYSMLIKITDSALFIQNDSGTNFENAIPLNPGKTLSGTANRSHNVYYKFKIGKSSYTRIQLRFKTYDRNGYEMNIYAEDEQKERTLRRSMSSQSSNLYYNDNLEPGIYYVVVRSKSLHDQPYTIKIDRGGSTIAIGNKFQEPIIIKIDNKTKEFSVSDGAEVWLQVDLKEFGELGIGYKLSEGDVSEENLKNLTMSLIGQQEIDIIEKQPFAKTDEKFINKVVGVGKYHLKVENNCGLPVKFHLNSKFKTISDNKNFETALAIPNATIYGLVTIKNTENKFFKLTSAKKGNLQVYSTFKFNKGDVNLKLYDAEKKLINQSETKTNDELLNATVEAGEYYLELENATKGLTNNINLNIDFEESGSEDKTAAKAWDVKIPEETSQNGLFNTETTFTKSSWSHFKLERKRRIILAIESETQAAFKVRIYHGIDVVDSSTSAKGNCEIDSELESGIYFVHMFSDAKEPTEITAQVNLVNKPSGASVQGEFDNITKDNATKINKTSLFPIEYQGEQALWYKIIANTNTDNLSVSLHSNEEKYAFTLSLYDSNAEEPMVVEYSNEFPVTITSKLQLGKTYFIKLEPVDPVQSSKLVLSFLLGPSRFRSNNMNAPFPLVSGVEEDHKVSNNYTSYYVLSFAGRTKYKISCTFDSAHYDLDLEFQRINGEIISDSEGTGDTEIIDGEIEPGLYRLIVRDSDQQWDTISYKIKAEYEIIGELLTPTKIKDINTATWKNISRETAEDIEANEPVKGTASSIPAWYSFRLDSNSNVTIELKFDHTVSNLDLFLVNSQGQIFATSAKTESPEVIQKLCTDGYYFIKVASFNDPKENSFELSIKLEDVGGGHSKESAIITKLRQYDKEDPRKFDVEIECTMKPPFPMYYVVVFERPVWIQLEGSITGGSGNGTLSLLHQNPAIGADGDLDNVAQLFLRDAQANNNRWRDDDDDEINKIKMGLVAGTYFVEFTGPFSKGTAIIKGTYIDGYDEKEKAPMIDSGIFKGLNLSAGATYWFKIKSNKTFKFASSVFSESQINNVKLALQSNEINVADPFSTSKSIGVFSELAAGEYYLMIQNTSDEAFPVDFQVEIIDDTHQFGKTQLLKANSKITGEFKTNSNEAKYYMFVIGEESKAKITFKILENRSYQTMTIYRITMPTTNFRVNNNDSAELTYENKFEPGVYIVRVRNNYYYRESKFLIEFEIQGSDFVE